MFVPSVLVPLTRGVMVDLASKCCEGGNVEAKDIEAKAKVTRLHGGNKARRVGGAYDPRFTH